jgi:hypothetical protein
MYCAIITSELTDEHFLEQKVEITSPISNLVLLLILEVLFQSKYSWT